MPPSLLVDRLVVVQRPVQRLEVQQKRFLPAASLR